MPAKTYSTAATPATPALLRPSPARLHRVAAAQVKHGKGLVGAAASQVAQQALQRAVQQPVLQVIHVQQLLVRL